MGLPIYLFDISAYLHRAMYVVYGDQAAQIAADDRRFIVHACGMVANTMEKLGIKRMALVCDSTEPSHRCDVFPAYKADRKPHLAVFAAQVPRFFDAMRDVSVAVVERPKYEADDLIAALNGQDVAASYVVVSSDKDLLACLGDRTRYYDPMKGIEVDKADVFAKYGIAPSQMYDYLGLVGDAQDGIPGVPGIGPKTAVTILRDFGTLDEVYNPTRRVALEEVVSKKKVMKLIEHQEDALLSRRLARPWPCDISLTGAEFDAPSPGIVRGACA